MRAEHGGLHTAFLTVWISGIVAFSVVIALSLPLTITAVPGGIGDHQAAGSAAVVNAIHAAWGAAGLMGLARTAIIADLVFIIIYGIGSVLGGLYFRSLGTGLSRHLGTAIALCGIVFLVSDLGETSAQLLQVIAGEGSDRLAGLAAMLRPIKMASWAFTFLGILAALGIQRRQLGKA